ncbi:MAG: hypothetical protein H0U87_08730 [Acidobacteria bacterium]|nr:hypothetical protein [Acidobacteriota bacterium]
MNKDGAFQIITFYEFKNFADEKLLEIKSSARATMREHSIFGTIILAREGFNATVSGAPNDVERFVAEAEKILDARINYKSSFHAESPFRRVKVKIKPEIVTLKQTVKIENAKGEMRASAADWNKIISDGETVVLDARNDYEFRVGTFRGAVNPHTEKFSDLPVFVEKNLNPKTHKKIAMFCTGGVRCEKFAPYLLSLGFETVYQLDGGILKYLEETPEDESLWTGECFVFDERVSVDEKLRKGSEKDLSAELKVAGKSK